MNRILINKNARQGSYGGEYQVFYLRNGKVVHKTIMFGNDLKYANKAYTKDFDNIKPERLSAKKLKKVI